MECLEFCRVVGVGRIGKPPQLATLAEGGLQVCDVVVEVARVREDGTRQAATLIACEVWGKGASAAARLQPGTLVQIAGDLIARKGGKEGPWQLRVSGKVTALEKPRTRHTPGARQPSARAC